MAAASFSEAPPTAAAAMTVPSSTVGAAGVLPQGDDAGTDSYAEAEPLRQPNGQASTIRHCLKVLKEADHRRWADDISHKSAFGRQLPSTRRTEPVVSFAAAPKARRAKDQPLGRQGALDVIAHHPMNENPSPTRSLHRDLVAPVTVLHGWGDGRRFLTDHPPATLATSVPAVVRGANFTSPFSATYPYEEPPAPRDTEDTDTAPSAAPAAAPRRSLPTRALPPPHIDVRVQLSSQSAASREHRAKPQMRPDLKLLQVKYTDQPSWSFGSSNVGGRFRRGTSFSRQPPCRTTGRLRGFRELRELQPQPTLPQTQRIAATLEAMSSARDVDNDGGTVES
eukprot:TRINITY_DN57703_c0_g1_i1.p1 TRINITY_DN57703_c0_g1~~TRINITY_DN57703_c0_g1_i1.p1  ORF type:complete len:360 (-),score=54.68 TRINITY_DN57703_c0_g1_i1:61-1074(-)